MAVKTKSEPKTQPVSIPAVKPGASAASLLASLTAKAQVKTPAAKKEKAALPLNDVALAAFNKWAPVKELYDKVESTMKIAAEEVKSTVLPIFINQIWTNKAFQSSFRLISELNSKIDSQAQFTVQERCKVQAKDADEAIAILNAFNVAKAEEIVANEISFQPRTAVRDFNELLEGSKDADGNFVPASQEQKDVATKILTLLSEHLSPDEQNIAIVSQPKITVKSGFLDRVTSYCANVNDLKAIFGLVQPVHFASHVKFAVGDDKKTSRLADIAVDIVNKANV